MAEDGARPVVHGEMDAKDQGTIRSFSREMCNWKIADGPIAAVYAGLGRPPNGVWVRGYACQRAVHSACAPGLSTRAHICSARRTGASAAYARNKYGSMSSTSITTSWPSRSTPSTRA